MASTQKRIRDFHMAAIVTVLFCGYVSSCGPGPRLVSPRKYKKTSPFVLKQHVPNVSEYTLGASGQPDGPIKRGDPRFKDLVENHDSNVIFRDEERDGSDRIMSKRCKDKLEVLAIKVMNQWPGNPPEVPAVKVRVKEAWDDNLLHGETSLHYEGRAVDIATSDRDRSKLGTLARLAVEAGFDWVEYESHGHVHCSVQSDSAAAVQSGGCFNADGMIQLKNGDRKRMSELQIGDNVMSMRSDGAFEYSEVIAFMDRSDDAFALFYTIYTESGKRITLTAKHLVYITLKNYSVGVENFDVLFAENVAVGQYLLLRDKDNTVVSAINRISVEMRRGIYAPLTKHGTILVDDVIASCYALIDNIYIAHASFAPMRMYHDISQLVPDFGVSSTANISSRQPTGVHWYARVLYSLGKRLFSKDTLYVH